MVYVFKKINNLTGDSPAPTSSSDVIDAAEGSTPAQVSRPHESTYQNPNNIYKANVGENMGNLDTGITKNIAETQKNIGASSDAYKNNLNNIDSSYNYGGRSDLENIGDTATFSRLNQMVNPATEQSQLGAIQSNTGNYNPDTAGLASSSTISGLSNQLKNQYGTTAGGSRLDAQLYRGSGQAGKAINDNLGQLSTFRQGKEASLTDEQNLLKQYQGNAATRAGQIQTEGNAYQQELLKNASDTASAKQTEFNQKRQQGVQQLQEQLGKFNYQRQLQDSIAAALGFSPAVTSMNKMYNMDGSSNVNTPSSAYENIPEKYRGTAESIYNAIAPKINLSQVDPNQFVTQAQSFTPEGFLDTRYNQLGQLLGTNQRTISPQDTSVNVDTLKYQQALQNQLQPQIDQAKQAAMSVLNQGNMTSDPGNPYVNAIQDLIRSPAFLAATGGMGAGLAAFSPSGKPIASAIQDSLADTAGSVGDAISSNFNPGSWF